MKRQGVELDVATYTTLITGFGKASQPDRALRLFEEMKQKSGVEPNIDSHRAIIQACEVGGRTETALIDSFDSFDILIALMIDLIAFDSFEFDSSDSSDSSDSFDSFDSSDSFDSFDSFWKNR